MYTRRKLILILFLVSSFSALLFPILNCNQSGKTASYHSFAKSEEFKKLSRQNQILKCAGCHKQEYENEQAGPHANAYKRLMEHKAYVNSDKYDSNLYKNRVNSKIETCAGCHSTQNLLENTLRDHSNMDSLTARVMAHPNPDTRADVSSRVTGVDCYTCHFDGNNFISLKSFNEATKETKDPNQSKTTLAKNNMSCYPCHFDVLDSFRSEVAINRTGSMLCVNCHVETDQQKKKTHYYYWKKDHPEKKNPLIALLLDDFAFKWAKDRKAVDITWENKSMPHTLPIATELIFKIELLGKDSTVLAQKSIRVNRKKQYDADSYEDLGNNYLGGFIGDDFPLYKVANYNIPVTGKTSTKLVRISYIDKAQFWLSDASIGRVLLTRVVALPE